MFDEDQIEIEDPDNEQEQLPKRNYTCREWVEHFKTTYGASIVTLLLFAYFNMGFRVMYLLSVKDLFKMYLGLEPAEAQLFSSLIALPAALKILYGLLVDNVTILGSSRNNYLKLCGMVMVLSLIMVQMPFMRNKYLIVLMLVIYGVANSIADVV